MTLRDALGTSRRFAADHGHARAAAALGAGGTARTRRRTGTTVLAHARGVALPFTANTIGVTSTSVRITVGPNAERSTLAMILDLVRTGAAR